MQAVEYVVSESPTGQAQSIRGSAQYAMDMARRLAGKLRIIDLRSYEPLSAEAAVSFMTRGAVQQVYQSMTETMRLLATLPVLILGDHDVVEDEAMVEDEAWLDAGDVSVEGEPALQHDRSAEEIDLALARLTATEPAAEVVDPATAASIWKMLGAQLRQCRARLALARRRRSKWAMIAEGEEGRRKALKALQYGMTLAMRLADWPEGGVAFPEDPAELQVALEVREALVSLRRDLLAVTSQLESVRDYELNIAVRDVRIRILGLFLAPVYKDLRAADRFALQALDKRIAPWLDTTWDDAETARRLLSDVGGFANLLNEVNNREILIVYDRRIREQCLEALDDFASTLAVSQRDGWWRYQRILRDANALALRDDTFSRFVATGLKASPRFGDHLADTIEATRRIVRDLKI